jgi:serine/threonine protein kinase
MDCAGYSPGANAELSMSSTNTLGRYQIIREIARSNDIVYEAIDPSINRRVALKELALPPDAQGAQRRERIERFWREGRAAGNLSHPNIVTIYEIGKDGDRHFIAMEYLEGVTLRDVLQTGGALPHRDVVNYALQLCSALAYAHEHGVIHRDIKPENIQILPGGFVKLTDFGIARLMGESSITQDGQVFGTPSYMSPEQVAGKEIDARSDVFSLGVVLYEMLAGQKPFSGDSVVTITYNIMNMEPPPPPGAPPYLASIVLRAMAKNPEMRYQTIRALEADLREERASGVSAREANAGGYLGPFGGVPQSQPCPPPSHQPPMQSLPDPSSAPDPFAYQQPMPSHLPTPMPYPSPVMSAETRSFLGLMLVILGLVGILVFAVWAVNLAYRGYRIASTEKAAMRYVEQGDKLYKAGLLSAAEEQYNNAISACPGSKVASRAEDGLYNIGVARAYAHTTSGDRHSLMEQAKALVQYKPDAPEGHYYLGVAYELANDSESAIAEYDLASKLAGNDEQGYGKAARERRDRLVSGSASGSGFLPKQVEPQPQRQDGNDRIPYQSPP